MRISSADAVSARQVTSRGVASARKLSERRVIPALVDVLSHEHDIRTALQRPGARKDPAIDLVAGELSAAPSAAVRIVLVRHDGGPTGDVDDTLAVLTTTPFELLRARLGRRTLDEVRALPWSRDPTDVLGGFFVFGPAERSIAEHC